MEFEGLILLCVVTTAGAVLLSLWLMHSPYKVWGLPIGAGLTAGIRFFVETNPPALEDIPVVLAIGMPLILCGVIVGLFGLVIFAMDAFHRIRNYIKKHNTRNHILHRLHDE